MNLDPTYFRSVKTQTCPYCDTLFYKLTKAHVDKCAAVPSAEKLTEMLNENPMLTLSDLSDTYRINNKYIIGLLRETVWDDKALKFRGKMVGTEKAITSSTGSKKKKRAVKKKSNRCRCGILVKKDGDLCEFCQENELGIKDYKTKFGVRDM